ncbi:hypothetical protein TSUD_160880 [Trifolium subterraneum]|uniref:Uncharacterized protein n=1 Tax=Trifolium subterraneum TaxID=3900 RepID=A0A2Z6MJM1_TRISU|nr:hypothetical protein TSUD_160880 [Trifolium subterraneum]
MTVGSPTLGIKVDDLEANHFVLQEEALGHSFGRNVITLLEESGFNLTAICLTGSGIHSFDTNYFVNLSLHRKAVTSLTKF